MSRSSKQVKREPSHLPVYNKLRARLEAGKLGVGEFLPKEDQLCSEYNVSRYALREAVRLLERQGYVERRRRAGTRVLARPGKSNTRYAWGSRNDLLEFRRGTTVEWSTPVIVKTDSKLARLLGCDELRQWYLLQGMRVDVADKRPIAYVQLYVDATRAELQSDADFTARPVYEWLEEKYNIRAKTVSQDITAVSLTQAEAKSFGERPGFPSLRIVRRYFDESQKIFQISVATHRSEDFIYNTQFHIER